MDDSPKTPCRFCKLLWEQTWQFLWQHLQFCLLFLWAVIWTSFLLYMVGHFWDQAPGVLNESNYPKERVGLSLVTVLGGIGGFIRWMHQLSTSVNQSENENRIVWLFVSLLTPLKGAALALLAVLVFRAGIGGNGGQSVNWIGLYAIAGLVGLFSPEAIRRLEAVFKSLFGEDEKK